MVFKKSKSQHELDIIGIFQVLLEKKIFIVSGVLLCILCSLVISLFLPEPYQIKMELRPGHVGTEDLNMPLVTLLKERIESGIYTESIIKEMVSRGGDTRIPDDISFSTTVFKNSKMIDVRLIVYDVELGKQLLARLYAHLMKLDALYMDNIINNYENSIRIAKISLEEYKAQNLSKEREVELIDQKLRNFDTFSEEIKAKNKKLNLERKKVLESSEQNQEKLLTATFYAQRIQQNTDARDSIIKEKIETLKLKQKIKNEQYTIQADQLTIYETINKTESLKGQVKKMQMVSEPASSPIRMNKKLNVIIASLFGLFFMVLSVFIIEFRNRRAAENTSTVFCA